MFFEVDRQTVRWLQKNLSRTRTSGAWAAFLAREECWTPATLAALVDEHDRLQLDGQVEQAHQIARGLPLLASRIRTELCPGKDLGKSSLTIWATAVFGSSLRALGETKEATLAFAGAAARAKAGAFPWALGELHQRHAFFLLHLGDHQALAEAARALAEFADHPDHLAETYNLCGVVRATLEGDRSAALEDFGRALHIAAPRRSERSRWCLQAALGNIARLLATGAPCSLESVSQVRQLVMAARRYLAPGLDVRKARLLWVEGLLVYRVGWNRHGERLLQKARAALLKFGRNQEFAVATLDLAVMLHGDGEIGRAQNLIAEVADILAGQPAGLLATHLASQLVLENLHEARSLAASPDRQPARCPAH